MWIVSASHCLAKLTIERLICNDLRSFLCGSSSSCAGAVARVRARRGFPRARGWSAGCPRSALRSEPGLPCHAASGASATVCSREKVSSSPCGSSPKTPSQPLRSPHQGIAPRAMAGLTEVTRSPTSPTFQVLFSVTSYLLSIVFTPLTSFGYRIAI